MFSFRVFLVDFRPWKVSLILYIEVKKEGVSNYEASFDLQEFDTKSISAEERKVLLEKLLAEDRVEAELEQSGDDYENRKGSITSSQFRLLTKY